jgi:hypothetical protein
MKEPAKNQELKRRSFNSLLWIIFLGPLVKGQNWFYDFWEPLVKTQDQCWVVLYFHEESPVLKINLEWF